jgi:TonB family protein
MNRTLALILLLAVAGWGQDKPAAPKDLDQNKPAESQSDSTSKRNITAPRVIHHPNPEYTKEGKKNKIQGSVWVVGTVGPDGKITETRVVRGLGYGLDEKALEILKKWRFEPAMIDGKIPTAAKINVEVGFYLY